MIIKNSIKTPSALLFHTLFCLALSFAPLAFERNPYLALQNIFDTLTQSTYFIYVTLRQIAFFLFGGYIYCLCQSEKNGDNLKNAVVYIGYFQIIAGFVADVFFIGLSVYPLSLLWQAILLIYAAAYFALGIRSKATHTVLFIPFALLNIFEFIMQSAAL